VTKLQPRQALGLAIAAGIALRLALIVAGGPPEQYEQDVMARNILAGRGYVYDQLGTPYHSFYAGIGYVAINVAVDWAFPSQPKAMLVAQSLYAGLLAAIVFQIAARFFDEWHGVAAAALTLAHPALLFYDVRKLHPLGFDTLMMTASVWLTLRLSEPRRWLDIAASGVVLGFAILQRGSLSAFFAGALVWLLLTVTPRARAWRTAAVYAASVLVVVGSWAARNYALQGAVLLESMTPQQLWKGNATYSNGSGYLADGRNVYDAAPESLVQEWRHGTEASHIRLFRDEAYAEMRKDPVRAVTLDVKKFVYFWTVPPNAGQQYPPAAYGVYLAYYGAVVLAAAIGLIAAFRQPATRQQAILIAVLFVSVSFVHALMFIEMRHRWATEPVMLAFVPAGARAVWMRWFR